MADIPRIRNITPVNPLTDQPQRVHRTDDRPQHREPKDFSHEDSVELHEEEVLEEPEQVTSPIRSDDDHLDIAI